MKRAPPPRREPQGDARAAAAWVVERTLASLAPVDGFLASALERFDERDQGFLRELVFGTLRWLRRLDAILAQAANRPLAQIEPVLLAPLRVGAYQLLLLDRVPAHAVVDEAVTLAGQLTHRGGASFVNAVLRRIARSPALAEWPVSEADPVARLALELAHPEFLVRRWWQRFGEAATRSLLEANNRAKPIHLMAFRDRGGRELLAEALIDAGVEVEPSRWSPLGLIVRAGSVFASEPFRRGDLYVQDEAGQAAALLLAPRPGERVLDAAAAPGGKGLALLAAEAGLELVAADVAIDRLDRLRKNYRRLGRRIPIVAADASQPGLGSERFDRVIVDLPCTGTGTLRKHPELKWRVSEGEIGRLASLGRRLLDGSAQLVVPGGYLQAITCSLEQEENEAVGEAFLAAHPEFERAGLDQRAQPPLDQWVTGPGLWRMLTAEDHDGFTVQVFRRRGSAR
jgi:16S rRNA (cytosine967-C5)-methyltransferase